jgi:HEAT repeat protein
LRKRYDRWANASDDKPRMAVQGFKIVAGIEGKPPLPALIHLLRSSDNASSRGAAARALEYFGTNAQETLPALAEAFSDPDKAVREAASEAVAVISSTDPPVMAGPNLPAELEAFHRYEKRSASLIVPALTKLLVEQPTADEGRAIQTLGCLGMEAKAALPAIRKRLTSPDPSIREAATNAMARIGQ